MEQIMWQWGIGLFVSLVGGHIAARTVLWALWKNYNPNFGEWPILRLKQIRNQINMEDSLEGAVPESIMGAVERLFFTIIVATAGTGVGAGTMMAWLGVKVAINWKRQDSEYQRKKLLIIQAAQGSTLASLMSFLFALLGGLIAGWSPASTSLMDAVLE